MKKVVLAAVIFGVGMVGWLDKPEHHIMKLTGQEQREIITDQAMLDLHLLEVDAISKAPRMSTAYRIKQALR